MADTELKIKVSAQLSDTKAALEQLTKQLAQIAQGGTELGAAATAGFARMEASAERAAAAARDVADASTRISTALEQAQVKAQKPPPIPKAPKAALTEGVADQNAIQKAALKQQLADLEASHKAGLTSEKAYYSQRAQIQRAALSAEIAQAKAMQAAATSQEARNRATTRVATLTQQRASISDAIPSTAGAEKGASTLTALLGKAGAAAASLGLAISAIGTATAFVTLADQAKQLEGRLKLATSSTEQYNIANAQLFAIAQRTRSSFGDLVGLYARLSMSTKALGTSQAELLRATETVSKAIKLSFTGSAESANAALMQLGQGLAAGTLRGDELNSVLEQAPRLAMAIAEGMGVTTGELKKLGEEGKITSQNVLGAIRNQAAKIDEEFKTLPRSIDGSMTVLKNSLLKGAGEIDRIAGITGTLASALEGLGPIVERVASKIAEHFARAQTLGGNSIQQLTKDAGSLAAALDEDSALSKALSAIGEGFSSFFSHLSKEVNDAYVADMKRMATETIKVNADTKRLALTAAVAKAAIASIFSGASTQYAWRTYREQMALVQKEMEQGIKGIEGNMRDLLKASDRAVDKLRTQSAESQRLADSKIPEPMGPPPPPKPLEGTVDYRELQKKALADHLVDLKAAYDAEYITTEQYLKKQLELKQRMADLEIAQARVTVSKATTSDAKSSAMTKLSELQREKAKLAQDYKRDIFIATESGTAKQATLEAEKNRQQLEDLKRKYDQGLESTADYYRDRLSLQEWALNQEVAAEKVALSYATTVEARDAAKTRLEMLELKRAELHKQRNQDQVDDEKKTATTISELRTKVLAAEGKTLEARSNEIVASFAELRKKLEAEGNVDAVTLIDRLIGYETGKAKLEQVGTDIDKILARFRAAEQSAANSVLLGTAKTSAANQTREAAVTAKSELEKPIADLTKLAETSDVAKAKLAEVKGQVEELDAKSLTGIRKAFSDLAREFDGMSASFSSGVGMALRDNLATLFEGIITGSKRGTEAMKDFAKNFAKSVAAVIAQIMATRVAMGLLKGFSFLGFGTAASTAAPVKHAGGLVGAPGGPMRSVPLSTFFGAPRLHQGGALGLAGDEVPTILQRGEEVLSKNDPRNVRNQSNAPRSPTTMLVTLHPDHNHRTMRDWLEGELARVAATS